MICDYDCVIKAVHNLFFFRSICMYYINDINKVHVPYLTNSLLSWLKFLGASWYLLSIERQEACWRSVCDMETSSCQYGFFDCKRVEDSLRLSWFTASNITALCSPKASFYQFGIYGDAVTSQVTTASFFHKYFFCLWWGLRNLR